MVKRVTIGFLGIVALLFVAGMISMFELGHLSNDAEKLMDESRGSMESAKEMLDAIHGHGTAVTHIVMTGHDVRYDTLCMNSLLRLEATLVSAAERSKNNAALDSLVVSVAELHMMTEELLASEIDATALEDIIIDDFDDDPFSKSYSEPAAKNYDIYWYDVTYSAMRNKIADRIDDYITFAFTGLTPQTEQLSRNAYRAVTPVLISLLVMIAIVLMLFYFVMLYCVLPIKAIDKSLADWLAFRKSFTVKAECRDELSSLKEHIGGLIDRTEKNEH
ncbi:MAG: hypothetical protein J1E04_02805 [Alistipes sp.]|nr:hypothetical protein [Alistipes sp.]